MVSLLSIIFWHRLLGVHCFLHLNPINAHLSLGCSFVLSSPLFPQSLHSLLAVRVNVLTAKPDISLGVHTFCRRRWKQTMLTGPWLVTTPLSCMWIPCAALGPPRLHVSCQTNSSSLRWILPAKTSIYFRVSWNNLFDSSLTSGRKQVAKFDSDWRTHSLCSNCLLHTFYIAVESLYLDLGKKDFMEP